MSLVIKNIFWLIASRAVALFFLFLAYAQLFRYLGPFGSGQYQFVLSYVLIFSTVVDFGAQQFITKRMSEDPQNTKKYFQSFFIFETVIAVFLYTLLLAVAYFRGYEPIVFKAVAITGLGMAANALCYPYLAVMTAKQDLRKVAFINFLNSLVNITVIFLAIWLKKYIVFLASIQLVFGILDLILYKIFVRKHLYRSAAEGGTPPILGGDKMVIIDILKSAWPFGLLVGFSAIYNRIDVIIITKLLGFAQTGLYTAAYKFVDLLNFFPASVSHTLFPVLAGLMMQRMIFDVKVTLEKYLRIMIAVALPMAVGGTILSKQLIILVAGQEFSSAAPVLSILIWAVAILFIYIPVNSLIISQLTKFAALVTGVNVLINIIGNIVLIPIYGIKAAAAMTVVSESIQGVFYFYFVRKKITDFAVVSILWKPLFASALMGLVVWSVRGVNLIFSTIIGAGVYALMLLLIGFIRKEDVSFLRSVFKQNT
ncbi:MAG: flippase [Candidatus Doudnabacteria bacterium]|nr:flippase [Candidatus Doudnabacteria bacterium]